MSKVIKGGTVVTADRTYQADVLIEGEKIAAIGDNLKGDETVDATDAYVIPGGIDPHTHLETWARTRQKPSRVAPLLRHPAAPPCWSTSFSLAKTVR